MPEKSITTQALAVHLAMDHVVVQNRMSQTNSRHERAECQKTVNDGNEVDPWQLAKD